MKHTIKKQAAQGDLWVRRVDALPDGVTESKDTIVAHSETGHDHVAIGKVKRFETDNPLVCFLSVEDEAQIVHTRPTDTHATIALSGGIWEVRNQVERSPEGWRRVED